MKKLSFRKRTAPTGDSVELNSADIWMVSWYGRSGQYSGDTHLESRPFLTSSDANHFKDQLRAAFKLICHTSGDRVWINKQ